jgi:type IX secretion system PorP/SprF family membrane protein
MNNKLYIFITVLLVLQNTFILHSQENNLSHYFATAPYTNPATAGDTRFIQVGLINRLQPLTGASPVYHTLFTFDQKLRNYRSGMGITLNQKTAGFKEIQFKINYSYTWPVSEKYWLKGGLGLSWNFINSFATSYHYPDQYDRFGITGAPTNEFNLNERENYPAFAAGVLVFNEFGWFSLSADYLNRPKQDFAGETTRVPVSLAIHGGYLFQIDKYQRPRRIINRKGGLEPYSSIGPVAGFCRQGPFYSYSIGIDAFLHPVFLGLAYRQNNYAKESILNGVSSLNILLGYRNEKISIAYSYDIMISRTVTNYKGAHEISFIYYIFTIKEDYKKNRLIPFPNQLMY